MTTTVPPARVPANTALPAASAGAGQSPAGQGQQVDYMKIIVAQMTNLNPMDPSSGSDGMPLLLQAETLNQLNSVANEMQQLYALSRTSYGVGLVGRTIAGVDTGGNDVTGIVTAYNAAGANPSVSLESGATVQLTDIAEVGM